MTEWQNGLVSKDLLGRPVAEYFYFDEWKVSAIVGFRGRARPSPVPEEYCHDEKTRGEDAEGEKRDCV